MGERNFGFDSLESRLNRDMAEDYRRMPTGGVLPLQREKDVFSRQLSVHVGSMSFPRRSTRGRKQQRVEEPDAVFTIQNISLTAAQRMNKDCKHGREKHLF